MATEVENNKEDQDDSTQLSEEEKQSALKLFDELKTKVEQKKEFRERNLKAKECRPSEDELRKKDGSIKKNTAFTKKLKEISEVKRDALTNEFKNLNLTKYVSEAATNLAEAKIKVSDVGCAVHMCSLIHCCYENFSEHLMDLLQKTYSGKISKDDDKAAMATKYRLGLRFTGELLIAGVIDQDIGIALLHDMLHEVILADHNSDHAYMAVIVGFSRHCGEDLAGFVSKRNRSLLSKYNLEIPQCHFFTEEKQSLFKTLLLKYFESMKKHLINKHKERHKRARKDFQILQNKGELSSEREEENEKARKDYEKLIANMASLSEVFNEDMPDLPEDQTPQEVTPSSIDLQLPTFNSDSEFGVTSLWEDEDQRSFYENITDIRPFIPAILFEGVKTRTHNTDSESSDTSTGGGGGDEEGKEKEKEETNETNGDEEEDEQKAIENIIKETEEQTLEEEEEEEEEETVMESLYEEEVPVTISSGGGGAGGTPEPSRLEELMTRLPNLMNKKFVDEFATEFCLINSKLNRQKLAKTLFNVDKNRMDLIPYYACLVATLDRCLPDITEMIIEMLTRDFRFQLRKKDQIHIHTKIKNARFIAEMTKFALFPKVEAMKCITKTVQDFTHHNVELACTLIEHCGRYLLRSKDSHIRAKALLEIMFRKKQVQHLDGRQKSMIEDALYAANPPETTPTNRTPHPPLLAYILKLLYKDLNRLTVEKVLKQFRKLPWTDPEVFNWAVESCSCVWYIKFSNVHCVANLLAGLKPYQEEAVVWIIDATLEDIRLGLELNLLRMNQRRISVMKFLGELYNYQLIEANVIFRTLYTILTFGYNTQGCAGSLDPFDSYFRARLVCVLLDTCGLYFDHGSSKRKLDAFLIVFQTYLLNKRQPLPLEVEFMTTDTLLALRPNIVMFTSVNEATEALSALEKKFRSKMGDEGDGEGGREGGGGGEDSDEEDDRRTDHVVMNEEEEEEEEEEEDEDEEDEEEDLSDRDAFGEDAAVLKSGGPKLMACPEDDEFLADFEKMMNETRKVDTNAKVPIVDIAVPVHVRKGGGGDHTKFNDEGRFDGQSGQMKFTLVMKKGNKQQLKELNIPADNVLASGLKAAQQVLENEKKEMKRLVLTHDRRQEEERKHEEEGQQGAAGGGTTNNRQHFRHTQPQYHPASPRGRGYHGYHHHGNRSKPYSNLPKKSSDNWQ